MSEDELEDAIRLEREAVERLDEAVATIQDDLRWYWHWGDGCGGYVLNKLVEAARAAGYRFPDDPTGPSQAYKKAAISRRLSVQVMERDEYRCVECGTHKNLSCDHIVPESKGGPTTFENLQTMCRPCNSRKGNRG